jgi:hypothetical protein
MFVAHWPNGDAENKFRGIYDGPYDPVARFPDRANFLRSALAQDRWVILGYFVVLITCAVVFAVLVFSKTGKKLSHVILAAVLVGTIADLLERGFIYHMLDAHHSGLFGGLSDVFWIRGAEAMATIKWCALVVAVAAIPAAVLWLIRMMLAYLRLLWYWLRHHANWWDAAVSPEVGEADDQAVEADDEAAWREAYLVPDAAELIPKRGDGQVRPGRAPTALCLSGGGIRSACVSMGAMQKFASPRDDLPDRWADAPVLDSFDYVISVSGGGYSAGARLLAVQSNASGSADGRAGGAIAPLCERFSPGSVESDFVRRRCSYIADSPLTLLRALTEVLKNLLASLLILSSSAIILGFLLGMFVARVPLAAVVPLEKGVATPQQYFESVHAHPVAALVAIAIPVAGVLICIAGGLICEWTSTSWFSANGQAAFSWLARGAALLALLVFTLTFAAPVLMWLCLQRPGKGPAGAGCWWSASSPDASSIWRSAT